MNAVTLAGEAKNRDALAPPADPAKFPVPGQAAAVASLAANEMSIETKTSAIAIREILSIRGPNM
ncbi:MAG: hypothetical protein ACI8TX_002767 [Hyphomicrobiaceae bacterium]|jgi:hypothetical protein